MKTPVAALVFIMMLGLGSLSEASPSDYQTHFTFSQPVALPGVTLPPGKYVFRLADPTGERKTIRVTDEAGTRSYALLTALPAYRTDSGGDASVSLMRTPEGMPSAVRTWWPVGESVGFEFIYPEAQFAKLTGNTSGVIAVAGSGLPSNVDETEPAAELTSRGAVNASPVNAAGIRRARTTLRPLPAEPVAQAESSSTESATSTTAMTREYRSQPRNPLPMIVVLGTLTFFAAMWALGKPKA
jgi:hypothetical protein